LVTPDIPNGAEEQMTSQPKVIFPQYAKGRAGTAFWQPRTLPVGICGSGLIDLLAEMLREGIIDRGGRFSVSHRAYNEFVVAIDGREKPGLRRRTSMS
jgi:hypothetical protein